MRTMKELWWIIWRSIVSCFFLVIFWWMLVGAIDLPLSEHCIHCNTGTAALKMAGIAISFFGLFIFSTFPLCFIAILVGGAWKLVKKKILKKRRNNG